MSAAAAPRADSMTGPRRGAGHVDVSRVSKQFGPSTVLSELESHVLGLYLDGHSYTGIGEQLGCDCKTVDNALQRVKRKVGAHLRSRAVVL